MDRNVNMLQRFIALIGMCLAMAYLVTSCGNQVEERRPVHEDPFQPLPESIVSTDTMEGVDFSRFKHDSVRHAQIPCLLCHQQKDEASRPQFALHTPCAGCHTQQFADNKHPICATCHTESGSAELKRFPSVRSFRTRVDHSAHFAKTECSTCHSPQGSGMSVPNASEAHSTCFQCHTSDMVVGDRNIGSCSTCHEPGSTGRISDSAAEIGFNFNHNNHRRVSCNECHNTRINEGKSAIAVSMHKGTANNCAQCHNERRAFGANDISDCRRCHQEMPTSRSFGVRFNHSAHSATACATCHKGGNVNFSVPNTQAAHNTCFQCHSPGKSAPAANTCFTCHQFGRSGDILPSRSTIPGNFKHSAHPMDCDTCHTSAGAKMSMPAVAMHKASGGQMACATCHDNQGAFGNNFADCKRCHTGGAFGR